MKKTIKIILIVLAAVLAVALGIGLYFASPMLAMKPVETGQISGIDPPVYALRSGRGNLYLVDTNAGGWLMIDAGASADSVEAGLTELGIEPAQVRWILLTHSHGDHVAGLPLFSEAARNLRAGDKFLVGDIEIDCVAVPGHTPDSMAYLVNGRYLFTGDALRYSNGKMSVHPFTQDKAQAQASIEKIKSLADDAMILTSHYGIH